MVIFGYIIYVIATVWLTLVALGLGIFNSHCGGKWGWDGWIILVVLAFVWYGAFTFSPFEISMKP